MVRFKPRRVCLTIILILIFYLYYCTILKSNDLINKLKYHVRRIMWSNLQFKHLQSNIEMEKNCHILGEDRIQINASLLHYILVDDKHKFLFCDVPRVASTNWKRYFLLNRAATRDNITLNIYQAKNLRAAEVHGKYKNSFHRLSDYSTEEINYRIRTYFKFFFVRNPFERLASVYRNKFQSRNEVFYRFVGKKILKLYHKGVIDNSTLVQMKEFVSFILKNSKPDTPQSNEHWRSQATLCQPCFIKYNYIGRYENFEADKDFVIMKIGLGSHIEFPSRKIHYHHTPTGDMMQKLFSEVSIKDILQLREVYQRDLQLFDYSIPDIGRPALKQNNLANVE